MDLELSRELAAFSPRWQQPRRRAFVPPDLPWLTVLCDQARAQSGAQLGWAIEAARAAARYLGKLLQRPGPLEIWLEEPASLIGDTRGISGTFSDGVIRVALAQGASQFSVVHEIAHYLTTSLAATPARRQGAERLALVLLEEYLAQRVAIGLLVDLGLDTSEAVIQEARGQSRQVVLDYGAVRDAFKMLIIEARAPANLRADSFALTRTFAYLAGTGISPECPAGLPRGLGGLISARLCPALAQIEVPADLRADRVGLAARLGLIEIVTELLSEVASNALATTPKSLRHPDWPLAFSSVA